jgi:hypothetical protein
VGYAVQEPSLVGWLLVALSAATGAYCLARMGGERVGQRRRAAGAEALMGWGMAVMAVPHTVLDPQPWGPPVFCLVFGAAAGWAVVAVGRSAGSPWHHLHHAVEAGAMVYMALAMAPGASGHAAGRSAAAPAAGGMPGMGVPLLTGLLLGYFAVYVLCVGARLVPVAVAAPDSAPGAGAWRRRPELATACRVSMGIGMSAMLLML